MLSNYVGTWDVSTTTQSPSAVGEFTAKWVLDGRFVQTNGSVKTSDGSNDFEITSLMTYDRERDVYRTWSFMSNGMASEAESTWDPATRTMTKIARYGDVTRTTTSSFRPSASTAPRPGRSPISTVHFRWGKSTLAPSGSAPDSHI